MIKKNILIFIFTISILIVVSLVLYRNNNYKKVTIPNRDIIKTTTVKKDNETSINNDNSSFNNEDESKLNTTTTKKLDNADIKTTTSESTANKIPKTTTKINTTTKLVIKTTKQHTTTTKSCGSKKFDFGWFRADFTSMDSCTTKGDYYLNKYDGKYSYSCSYMNDDCGVTFYMLALRDEYGVSYDWHNIE